jgi:hypothetical protein
MDWMSMAIPGAGSESTDDASLETVDEVEGSEDGTEGDQENAEAETEGDESDKADGRAMPPKLRSLLKELQAKDPKLAKELKGSFFTAKSFQTVFASPKEAAKAKEVIESLGGAEGIQSLESERAAWGNVDAQLANGDPKLIENIARDNPEGFVKLAPVVMERFAQADPEGYNRVIAGVFHSTFQSRGGLVDALATVARDLQDGKPENAAQVISQIQQWINGFEKLATSAPSVKKQDPERAKLEQEKAEWQKQKLTNFNQSVAGQYNAFKKDAVTKQLDGYLKGRKIDADTYTVLESNIMAEVGRVLDLDKDFKAQLNKLQRSLDQDGITKLLKSRTEKLLPDAVKKVYNLLSRVGGGGPQKSATKPNAAGTKPNTVVAPKGFIKVNKMPPIDQVDHSRTTYEMKINNQVVLKNGKRVTWED